MRWLAAFGESKICLISATTAESIDIDRILQHITTKNLSYYTHSNLIPSQKSHKLFLAGFEYIPLGDDMSYLTDLVLKYELDYKIQITETMKLEFSAAWLRAEEVIHLQS